MSLSACAARACSMDFRAHSRIIIAIFRPRWLSTVASNGHMCTSIFSWHRMHACSHYVCRLLLLRWIADHSNPGHQSSAMRAPLEIKCEMFSNVINSDMSTKLVALGTLDKFNLFLGYFRAQRQRQVIWHAHHVVQFMQMCRRPWTCLHNTHTAQTPVSGRTHTLTQTMHSNKPTEFSKSQPSEWDEHISNNYKLSYMQKPWWVGGNHFVW